MDSFNITGTQIPKMITTKRYFHLLLITDHWISSSCDIQQVTLTVSSILLGLKTHSWVGELFGSRADIYEKEKNKQRNKCHRKMTLSFHRTCRLPNHTIYNIMRSLHRTPSEVSLVQLMQHVPVQLIFFLKPVTNYKVNN